MLAIALILLFDVALYSFSLQNTYAYNYSTEIPVVKFHKVLETYIPLRDIYSALNLDTITTLYIYRGFPKVVSFYENKSYLEIYIDIPVVETILPDIENVEILFRGYDIVSKYYLNKSNQLTIYAASLYRYDSFYISICLSYANQFEIMLKTNSIINNVSHKNENIFNVNISGKELNIVFLDELEKRYEYHDNNIVISTNGASRCIEFVIGFSKTIKYFYRHSVYNTIEFSRAYFLEILSNLPKIITNYKLIQDLYMFNIYVKLNKFSKMGYIDFYTNVNPLDIAFLSYFFTLSNSKTNLFYLAQSFKNNLYNLSNPLVQYSYVETTTNLYKIYGSIARNYVDENYLEFIYNSSIKYVNNSNLHTNNSFSYIELGFVVITLKKLKQLCKYLSICANFSQIDYYYFDQINKIFVENNKFYSNWIEYIIIQFFFNNSCNSANYFVNKFETIDIRSLAHNYLFLLAIASLAQCRYIEKATILLNKYYEIFSTLHTMAPGFEYIVLRGFYGVEIESKQIVLTPSLPPLLANTSIVIYVDNKKIDVHYLGWGYNITEIYVDMQKHQNNRIPIDVIYRRIYVKLNRYYSSSLLEITINKNNKSVSFELITIYSHFCNFSTNLYSNENGTIRIYAPCLCPINIVIDDKNHSLMIEKCEDVVTTSINIIENIGDSHQNTTQNTYTTISFTYNTNTTTHTYTTIHTTTIETINNTSNNLQTESNNQTLNVIILLTILILGTAVSIVLIRIYYKLGEEF